MKVFLLLAIVAFTGCQARDPTDAILYEISKVTRPFDDALKMIKESQLGQEVNARITEFGNVAEEYVVTLQENLRPLTQDFMTIINKEAEVLKERLEQDLTTVRDKLEPYVENLKTQIQQRVEDLRVAVAPYADSFDSDTLKTTVLQKTEELSRSLEEKVKELQSQLEPYTDDLRQKVDQHLEEFQKTVAPLTEDLQAKVAERAALVQQGLAPYAEDLKEKLDPYVQNLNDRLRSLYESYINTIN
ncbi:apolipoprotein A-IV-like [Tachysurus vachellii]|uniref:apolipoprotein A-IV-like n=1 Tax=Tachysurus vachellii TaxID=175792 RepID=UPI00296B4411|nr:apolipoprotein A-IV-like [Tachysurus vachellii]